jgi:predicted TPR repeat methyltransferase
MEHEQAAGQTAHEHFERLWSEGDHWELETSEYEAAKYQRQLRLLQDRTYDSAVEIGCGGGVFTASLARISRRVLAMDISESAIERARARTVATGAVDLLAANIMEHDVQEAGPWDLIVMSETVCCLGWLYTFFEIGWLAERLFAATREEGRLLMANTFGQEKDHLMRPAHMRTYRDLMVNTGYTVEKEDLFRGTKHGVEFECLISLFQKR